MNYHFIWKLLVTLQIDDLHVRGAKDVFMPTKAPLPGGAPSMALQSSWGAFIAIVQYAVSPHFSHGRAQHLFI